MNTIEELQENLAQYGELSSEKQELLKKLTEHLVFLNESGEWPEKLSEKLYHNWVYRISPDYTPDSAKMPTQEETIIAAEESEEAALECGVCKYDILRKIASWGDIFLYDLGSCALCRRHDKLDDRTNCPLKQNCEGECIKPWSQMITACYNNDLTGLTSAANDIYHELSRLLEEERAKKIKSPPESVGPEVGRKYKITPIDGRGGSLKRGIYTVSGINIRHIFTSDCFITMEGKAGNEYRISSYTFELIPEEKIVECEVKEANNRLYFIYKDVNRKGLGLALNIPNFAGYKFKDGTIWPVARRIPLTKGQVADKPTHVLFLEK